MKKMRINWDALGIGASLACAIHCALLPLLLTSASVFGVQLIDNIAFEFTMIGIALCIGLYALYHGYKKHHGNPLSLIIFSVGMTALFAKEYWHNLHLILLLPAVLCIVVAHYLNYRLLKKAYATSDDFNHQH
jgi:hypothetical protein